MAVETGGGGRVLEDPDELMLAAFIPPKLYCMLRIPPEAGLTARAIPVASKIKVIISIGMSQYYPWYMYLKKKRKKTHLVPGLECY